MTDEETNRWFKENPEVKNEISSFECISVKVSYMVMVLFSSGFFIEKFSYIFFAYKLHINCIRG